MYHVLLLLHDSMSITIMKSVLQKSENAYIHVFPKPDSSKPLEGGFKEAVSSFLSTEVLTPNQINMVVAESNYGMPGSTKANEALFTYLLTDFSQAKLIAYSSTSESLLNACALHKDITPMTKGAFSLKLPNNSSEEAGEVENREYLHSPRELKELIKQEQLADREEQVDMAAHNSPTLLPLYNTSVSDASKKRKIDQVNNGMDLLVERRDLNFR